VGRGLILVRHAMPVVSDRVPSTEWTLSESSMEECVLLAHCLPTDLAPVVHSSSQPKAERTAAVIALRRGLTVEPDEAFREVDKSEEWFDGDEGYRAAVATYLRDGGRPDWEEHAAVARRFGDAVDRALAANPLGDLVVVNHGMALSLYVASREPIDLVPFWRALTFPDAWRLDLETGELLRLFEQGIVR
jgi:2,3-bisphosphoglycerate-dependent phosphoglycerate mutase